MDELSWGVLDDREDFRAEIDLSDLAPPAVTVHWLDAPAGPVADLLAPYDVLLAMRERTPFPADLLERLPRLKLLVTTGLRNGAIDLDAATGLGILVAGAPGAGAGPMEHTWALILAAARRIPWEDTAVRAGRWGTTVGTALGGRTLGLLGFGTIARKVAQVGRAFDMDVIATSRSLTAAAAAEHGVTAVDLDELLRRSDVLSIHVPGNASTRGLVGARELALLRPTAILVNTSRGPVVDEAALIGALRSGRLGGAGLDVYDVEPLPADHPFTTLDRVVLSPHRGYVTDVGYTAFYRGAAAAVRAFVDGSVPHLLNPAVLESSALRWPAARGEAGR